VARVGEIRAVGLDAEPAAPLDLELWDKVLTPPEMRWLSRQPSRDQGLLAKVIFSAKECTYKCQYLIQKSWLDFSDLEIEPLAPQGDFLATFVGGTAPAFPAGTTLRGRLRLDKRWIFTAMTLLSTDR